MIDSSGRLRDPRSDDRAGSEIRPDSTDAPRPGRPSPSVPPCSTMMATTTPTSPDSPPPRRRRFLRRLGIGVLLSIFGLVLVRNQILTSVLHGELHRRTGGDVRIQGVDVTGLNHVEIEEIRIDAPGWSGPAGEVLQIRNLSASIRLLPLLVGAIEFETIQVDLVRVRIAERADDPTELNVMSLEPIENDSEDDDDPDDPRRTVRGLGLGTIEITKLDLESGIERSGQFEAREVSTFNASLDPPTGSDSRMAFTLAAIEAGRTTAIAKGHLDEETGAVEFRIDDVDVAVGTNLALSATARAFVAELDLGGVLKTATVNWKPGQDPEANLEVENLAITLPAGVDLESEWVRFQDGHILEKLPPLPRIELESGRITLIGQDLLVAGERGRIVSSSGDQAVVPVEASAEIRVRLESTPTENEDEDLAAWGMRLVREAPFQINLELKDFQSPKDSPETIVDLPRPVAKALSMLTARQWNLTARAQVLRGSMNPDSPIEADAPILASAELWLTDGEGMYEKFGYPLKDVDARLTVEDETIEIEFLSGIGPSGGRLGLTGVIEGTGDDAAVDLTLRSERIALDDHLLSALPDSTERGVRSLFDRTAYERLKIAGLLADDTVVASARKRLAELVATRTEAETSGDEIETNHLEPAIARCNALIAAGPFELGGFGAIDLRVHRPRGVGIPVAVEGRIKLDKVGGIFSRFPYPMIVNEGTIILEDLAVILESPGFKVTTSAGGEGRITGRVDLPRDGRGSRDVFPELEITIANDRLNPTLLAAVPPGSDDGRTPAEIPGWPGETRSSSVQSIIDMGLEGDLDYHGRISSDADGDTTFDFTILLDRGSAAPGRHTGDEVAEAGLIWPRDFKLDSVRAVLTVDDDTVALQSFSGRRGAGHVTAEGTYDIDSEIGGGTAELRDLAVEQYLLDLIPTGSLADARELWRRWNPEGAFDATLHWAREHGDSEITLDARPRWIAFDTGAGRTRADIDRGECRFRGDAIFVDDLAIRFSSGEGVEERLRINGGYGLAPEIGILDLDGIIDEGRFESPAMDEVFRLAIGEGFAEWWRARAPRGEFDGRFSISSGGERSVRVDLRPERFTILSIAGDPDSRGGGRVVGDGRVIVDDDDVLIGPLELMGERETLCRFTFRITDFDAPSITGDFRIEAPDSDAPEVGFLTPPFSSIIGTGGLASERLQVSGDLEATYGPTKERDADDSNGGSMADDPVHYRAHGAVQFETGKWDLGSVHLTDIDGQLRVRLEATHGNPTAFDLDARLDRLLVEGRLVQDVLLRGDFDPADARHPLDGIGIDIIEGTVAQGIVRGDFRFDFDGTGYELDLQVHDADLAGISRDLNEPGPLPGPLPGRLSARVALEGIMDEPASRIGRGRLLVEDARLADGGSLALLQLGQLMPPIADELATAKVNLWINGGEALLENVTLESETLIMAGDGRLRLDDWQWSLRLLPKGTLPGLSDLVSMVSGTLAAIDVAGTPGEPKISLTPLPMVVPPPDIEPMMKDQGESAPTNQIESDAGTGESRNAIKETAS